MIDFIIARATLMYLMLGSTVLSFLWLFFACRKKLNAKWWDLLIASISATIVGILATVLFGMIESGFKVTDATSLFGSIFIVPLFCLVYAKIRKLPYKVVLDSFTIVLVISAMTARINCIISGCCYGKFIGDSYIRHPVREVEIGYDVLFIGVTAWHYITNKFEGKLYIFYLVSYGFIRFILESLRYSPTHGFFHIGHAWSLVAFLFGIGYLIISYYLKRDKEKNSN